MERPSFDGVKFYGARDWSSRDNLQKSALILDKPIDNVAEHYSINEIIQFYNVQQTIGCGNRLTLWNDDEYSQYVEKSSGLSAIIGKFLNSIDDNNLEETYEAITIGYVGDFWELFEKYKVYNHVSSEAFAQLLNKHEMCLQYVLKYKSVVDKYDIEIAHLMKKSKQTAEIITRTFLEKHDDGRFVLPKSFSKEEYEPILQTYINTTDCNPSILHLIAIAQSSANCPLSDKLILSARKRQEERYKEMMDNSTPIGIQVAVSFIPLDIVKKKERKGSVMHVFYDTNWLNDNLDYPTILNNFIYIFDQFDICMRSKIAPTESQQSVLERFIGRKGIKEFRPGFTFHTIQKLSGIQVYKYYNMLLKNNICLEEVFRWFFEEYLVQEFNAIGFRFNSPSRGTNYIEKCRSITSEMDGVLKQFRMYVRDGFVDRELFEISSEHIVFSDITSMITNKYAYAHGEKIKRAMNMLFSDQTMLSFLPQTGECYHNCYELLKKRNCQLSEFEDYQKNDYQWLIDNKYIYIDENLILRLDKNTTNVLKDLYDHDVICPNHLHHRRSIVNEWLENGELVAENTLFSRPEQNYLNYMLNKSIYSNGMDLRNKYSHSSYPSDESQQLSDYMYVLIVMVLIIVKINDEFCLMEPEATNILTEEY